MPDYLGFGESKDAVPFHPSFISEYYALDAKAALDASRNLLSSLGQNIVQQKLDASNNPYLFLRGYSEGGYAALSVQRYFESLGEGTGYKITASAPGASIIDINLTAQRIFGRDYFPAPPLIGSIYFSYKRSYGYNFPNSEIFNSGRNIHSLETDINYGDAFYPEMSSRLNNIDSLDVIISNPNEWVTPIISGLAVNLQQEPRTLSGEGGLFLPMNRLVSSNLRDLWINTTATPPSILDALGFITALQNYTLYPWRNAELSNPFYQIYENFSENSLVTSKWTSVRTPTRLYHCSVDTSIPFANTQGLTGANLQVVTNIGVTNHPEGRLEFTGGTTTNILPTDSNFPVYSNHALCPLKSAAIPWFLTYVK